MDQFSSIISVLVLDPTGSLFVDHVDHDLFVKNSPFYCTRFDQTGRLNFADHDWFFYTILSAKDSITLSPSEVHVDPRWEWSESDG